ncbi:biopolymer transporter ExbD [candidate division WOR-3 bacterium]|nr:biopolymer transporter ExbD [candidate division WOR-3 bacterium]
MRYKPHSISTINLTALVDVSLTVLVIFMVSVPLLQSGIEIDLPKTEVTTYEGDEGITITITREKKVFIDEREIEIPHKELVPILVDAHKKVYIRGDKGVPYGFVMEIIGLVKSAGIEDVGLISELERRD